MFNTVFSSLVVDPAELVSSESVLVKEAVRPDVIVYVTDAELWLKS